MRKNLMTMLLILALAATGLNPGMTAQAGETDTEKEVYTLNNTDGAKAPSKNYLQEGNALFETAFYSPTLYMAASSEATTQDTKSGKINDTVSWTFSNGTLRITGTGPLESDDPDANVVWIDDTTLTYCSLWPELDDQIKTVIVEDGITSIGYASFFRCTALESVTLAESVTEIGGIAFANCFSLKKFDAPGVVTFKGQSMAYAGLEEIHFGKNVQSIDDDKTDSAFIGVRAKSITVDEGNPYFTAKDNVLFTKDMKTLLMYPSGNETTSYTIPEGVERIEDSAFFGCLYLNELTIPEGVKELGSCVFSWCEQLKEIKLPDSLEAANDYTFSDCHKLESVSLGNGLKETPMGMFQNCYGIENIDFGNSLEKLGALTFGNCETLRSVILPENIKIIDGGVFGNCFSLAEFTSLGLECGIYFQVFLNDWGLTTVNLNEGVTGFSRAAFLGCYGLEKIMLPKSVTYVHPYACETNTMLITSNTELTPFGKNGLRKLETIPVSGTRLYSEAYKVLDLLNEARAEQNLPALEMDESLLESAMQRAAELSVLFAHTRPDSSSCYEINKENLMSGENIAYGRNNAQDTMTDWMNSDGHRENILQENFKSIGIGCVKINGAYYWTQCFGGNNSSGSFNAPQDQGFNQEVRLATETFEEAMVGGDISFSFGESIDYTFHSKISMPDTYVKPGASMKCSYLLYNPGLESYFEVDPSYVIWSSSNPAVVLADNGTISSVGQEGVAEISASLRKGSYTSTESIVVSQDIPGDADRNGVVDANDALLVLRIAAKLAESTPETESIADVDGNKSVDANDALLILQKAAKLIDRFSIEG